MRVSRGPAAADERWWNWAIVTRAGPRRALGTVELSLRRDGAVTHLAYALGRAWWGAGYAREACAAALAYLRACVGANGRIEAFVDTRNARSIALLERLGFARTGFVAHADDFKGAPSDEFIYVRAFEEDDDAANQRR